VYDMYPWDSRADSPRTRPPAPRDGETHGDPETAGPATRAVQVALDRRDNGGDGAAAAALAAARHTADRSGQ
jgi:hypothetical protein